MSTIGTPFPVQSSALAPARWGGTGWYVRAVVAIDAFAGRSIFQIAFVVNNLEEALVRYATALNSGPWRCYTLGAEGHEACDYRGGATNFASRLALNERTPQLELIEPRRRPSAHQDWLNERGEGPYIDRTADLGLMIEPGEPPSSMPAIEFVWPEDTP